jgi:transcriptional regulator with XRE-family HTH domain
MGAVRGKPGAKKNVTKPVQWSVDPAFPERLKKAMKGMTAAELARRTGATRAVIGQYLKLGEKKNPHPLIVFAIADALEVSPRWLLTGSEDRVVLSAPTGAAKAKPRRQKEPA